MRKKYNIGILLLSFLCFYALNLYFPIGAYRLNLWAAIIMVSLYNPLRIKGKKTILCFLLGLLFCFAAFIPVPSYAYPILFFLYLGSGAVIGQSTERGLGKLIIFGASFTNLFVILATIHTDIQYDFPSCYNYIQYILDANFKFWTVNPLENYPSYSTYHPILHFYLGALSFRIGSYLVADPAALNEAMQILFWSYMVCYYIYAEKILHVLKIRSSAYLFSLALVCFFPIYNAIAGYFNNDCLLLALQAATIYYSLKFYAKGGKKNLFLIWFCITLGALTKLSIILVLPFTGFLVLLRFIHYRSEFKSLFCFGICCLVSLAIWPLYQHYMLGVRADFIPPQPHLSLENYSLWERFNPLKAFVYERMYYNDFGVNLWETMTKTALFGQWDFSYRLADAGLMLTALVVCYKVLLALILIGSLVLFLQRNRLFNMFLVLICGILGGHICFGLLNPYMCNMDFRYVAILVLPMAVILALMANKAPKFLRIMIYITMSIFIILSAMTWILLVA